MRARALLTSLLVALGSAALVLLPSGPSGADPADPDVFHDRWCSTGHAAPCIDSVTRNAVAVTPTTPGYSVTMTGRLDDLDYTDYVMWAVNGDLSAGEEWSVTLDMGTMKPRYTEGYSKGLEVTRTADGDGTFHVTMTGSPALMAEGCNDEYPIVCPDVSDHANVSMRFNGEVWNLVGDGAEESDRNGVDRSQNADMVNDPMYGPTSDGGYQLRIELANAPRYEDTPGDPSPSTFIGHAKFRLPYQHFKQRFEVPHPESLPESSVTGSTGGSGTGGTWTIVKVPSEKTFYVEVDGVTFAALSAPAMTVAAQAKAVTSPRVLRIKRGVITPYAPAGLTATRVTAGRGRLGFTASVPRGALPTGYRASCTNLARTHTRTATASQSPVVVTELRRGVAYDCKVRALSKAGPGVWSPAVRLAARP